MSEFTLYLGDCIANMRELADNSVDAIVTDPPYHLTTGKKGGSGKASESKSAISPFGAVSRLNSAGFMGQQWDGGDIAQRVELWAEALRVLKPGGHLLAFAGSRTYHRMVCAIEDAGFEVRDQIMWLYGSGMPKSRNLAKYDMQGEDAATWEGWGTGLKPSHEPICMARKQLAGTVAANMLEHGTGALNIDACRVPVEDKAYAANCSGDRGHDQNRKRDMAFGMTAGSASDIGRWPANLIHDGSAEVLAAFAAHGERGADSPVYARGADKFRGTYGAFKGDVDEQGSTYHDDKGTAARFFYSAKASRTDRNEGCEDLVAKPLHWSSGDQNPGSFQSEGTDKTSANHHPTVKPISLMRYLVRLVTPPGGVVLDPFMGSGSTGKAAMLEGFDFIGMELSPEYLKIALARIGHAQRAAHEADMVKAPQFDLFTERP